MLFLCPAQDWNYLETIFKRLFKKPSAKIVVEEMDLNGGSSLWWTTFFSYASHTDQSVRTSLIIVVAAWFVVDVLT